MKSIIFFATVALSSTSSVFGAPTTTSTLLTSRVQHPHVTASNTTVTARATNSWVCLAFSPSTTNIGGGVGIDESSAASAAIAQCAFSDCTVESSVGSDCVQFGCITAIKAGGAVFPAFASVAAGDEQEALNTLGEASQENCNTHLVAGSCGADVSFVCSDLS
jgi:hypothetical protein